MNDLTNFKGQKVAAAFAHLDPNKGLGDGIQGGFPILGYRGKVWSLRYQGNTHNFVRPDDGSALTYLDVIIVGTTDNVSRIYYKPGEWDEDAAGPPLCAAINGDVPDPGVPERQSPTCGTCKQNVWVTLPNGKRGKPCQDHKRLAVLLMPAVTAKMLGAPLTEPVYLKVPPGSFSALKSYSDSLRHQGYPFAAVVTRISFSQEKLFQMVFTGQQVLSDKEAPLVLPLLDDPRTKRITGEAPDIREVKAVAHQPIETGLLEAFGGAVNGTGTKPAAKAAAPQQSLLDMDAEDTPQAAAPQQARPRGRPPKAAAAPVQQPAEDVGEKAALPWDEVGTELDQEVADLLGNKVSDMLK